MRRPQQIIVGTTAFLLGVIYAANFLVIPQLSWLFLGAAALLALFIVRSMLGYVLIAAACLLLGMWRYDFYLANRLPDYTQFFDKKVEVVGNISGEPSWDEYRNYVFYLQDVYVDGQPVEGLLRIKTISGQAKEGQKVVVKGKLKSGLGKAQALISYADVQITDYSQPMPVVVKSTFMKGLQTTLSPQPAAFMAGILIGSRSGLDKPLQEALIAVGLAHMVAVSGYNLTILVGFMQRRLGKKWRWGSAALSLWAIAGFVILAGAGSSILRAGLMSGLFLLLGYYGKRLGLLTCLGLVAAGMVLVSPTSIISDISWQLSFLSLAGITILAPRISKLLPQKPAPLNDILAVTLAAQIATAGYTAYVFGQLSIIAPLANLIIMPAIPLLMCIGLVSGLLGILAPELAILAGNPISWLCDRIFSLITYLSNLPFSHATLMDIQLWKVAIYYLIVFGLVFAIRPRKPEKALSEKADNVILIGDLKEKNV